MNQRTIFRALGLGLASLLPLSALAAEPAPDNDSVYHTYKYRVYFKDKKQSDYSLKRPEEFLSQKSIERRRRQGLKLNATDLPVSKAYLRGVGQTGVRVLLVSKWNNTAVVECTDTTLMDGVAGLPYVTSTRKVATYSHSKDSEKPADGEEDRKSKYNFIADEGIIADSAHTSDYYGAGDAQIRQLNGKALHDKGFRGKGITIAVVDGGFRNVDLIAPLTHTDIIGTKDFVDPGSDVYGKADHGLMVLSTIGSNVPNKLVGTAPEASYWLLCSEDANSEQLVEEDNWAAAVEFADSAGVDVINSSLGYTKFNNEADNVKYSELDGKTHLISKTASLIASKGMILCNSAGNSAFIDTWKLIGVPADASDILTVGAVSENGENTMFSSIGHSYDGRVKPDVMARGGDAYLLSSWGRVETANGTSFASPIMTGMVACLWQALPNLNSYEIMELIRRSSDRYGLPDNVYGYGIPDFGKALEMGTEK